MIRAKQYASIVIRLESALHEALRRAAVQRKQTQTAIIREALEAYLATTISRPQVGGEERGK